MIMNETQSLAQLRQNTNKLSQTMQKVSSEVNSNADIADNFNQTQPIEARRFSNLVQTGAEMQSIEEAPIIKTLHSRSTFAMAKAELSEAIRDLDNWVKSVY